MLLNICSFANSFIWPNDLSIWTGFDGAVFCDIQVKIFIAGTAGMLGAIAAMARSLAKILSDNITVVRTKAVRRRELLKDLCLCLGIPLYMMLVHYIVQPSRYYLYSVTGCTAVVDRSWPSVVLLFIWPPVAALVAGYFAGMFHSP
jgi:pheromone a factor receptor